jgi:hypothetical protein
LAIDENNLENETEFNDDKIKWIRKKLMKPQENLKKYF